MSRVYYVNGQYVPSTHARVAMEDRGYQFADGVYEVVTLYDGMLIDTEPHLDRLERSLEALSIPMPMTRAALELVMHELIARNRRRNGLIYMQVTRGAATRNHVYSDIKPVLTMAMMPAKFADMNELNRGASVITGPDTRWSRCDIKSIALLPNIMARTRAAEQGAKEIWLMREDVITEGSLSNAYIVTQDGAIRTHPKSHAILGGVTRATVLNLARAAGIEVIEEAFTLDDVRAASEAFMSGASAFVYPIVQVDDIRVSESAGPVALQLIALYDEYMKEQAA